MPTPAHTRAAELLPLADADVRYTPEFIPRDAADALLAQLRTEVEWQQLQVRMFGREIAQPRLTAWHGDAGTRYRYSGIELVANGWTPALHALRTRIEMHCGKRFNSVLLNLYRDGNDSLGMHSDDEAELGPEPVIASVSLGAERPLVLRHRTREDIGVQRIALAHGSLLELRGATQAHWRHGIEKTRARIGVRVNLTFRFVYPRGRR